MIENRLSLYLSFTIVFIITNYILSIRDAKGMILMLLFVIAYIILFQIKNTETNYMNYTYFICAGIILAIMLMLFNVSVSVFITIIIIFIVFDVFSSLLLKVLKNHEFNKIVLATGFFIILVSGSVSNIYIHFVLVTYLAAWSIYFYTSLKKDVYINHETSNIKYISMIMFFIGLGTLLNVTLLMN